MVMLVLFQPQPIQIPSQTPLAQAVCSGHTTPHAPQFLESQSKSVPGGQLLLLVLQAPWLQIGADAGQTFPQAPQLCGSEFTAVHVPLQQAADVGQQAYA